MLELKLLVFLFVVRSNVGFNFYSPFHISFFVLGGFIFYGFEMFLDTYLVEFTDLKLGRSFFFFIISCS